MSLPSTPQILLVEGNLGEARLVTRALRSADARVRVTVAADGADALALLEGATRPALILLDLELPGRTGGRALLSSIRGVPRCRLTPILVLSGSAERRDVLASYELGANGFIPRPPDLAGYERLARALIQHWFAVVCLPAAGAPGRGDGSGGRAGS